MRVYRPFRSLIKTTYPRQHHLTNPHSHPGPYFHPLLSQSQSQSQRAMSSTPPDVPSSSPGPNNNNNNNNNNSHQTDPDASPSTQPQPQPQTPNTQALPAPGDPTTTQVAVGGESVKLDHLGPLVVNADGTMSRITNWDRMAEVEREATLRIIGKRNKARLAALKEAKNSEG